MKTRELAATIASAYVQAREAPTSEGTSAASMAAQRACLSFFADRPIKAIKLDSIWAKTGLGASFRANGAHLDAPVNFFRRVVPGALGWEPKATLAEGIDLTPPKIAALPPRTLGRVAPPLNDHLAMYFEIQRTIIDRCRNDRTDQPITETHLVRKAFGRSPNELDLGWFSPAEAVPDDQLCFPDDYTFCTESGQQCRRNTEGNAVDMRALVIELKHWLLNCEAIWVTFSGVFAEDEVVGTARESANPHRPLKLVDINLKLRPPPTNLLPLLLLQRLGRAEDAGG